MSAEANHNRKEIRSLDESYDEETIGDDEYFEEQEEEEVEEVSLDDILTEKLERIAVLEQANRTKDEELGKVRQQMTEIQVKHKQGVYWLQLELDTARRERDASEERMAELYNDLEAMTKQESEKQQDEAPASYKETLAKYEQSMAILENQVSMVQTSCGEVVKTLKEEISDLMEDRCRNELDLLNQIAALDDEKRNMEQDFTQQLQLKNETLQRLRAEGGQVSSISDDDIEEYEIEFARLRDAKRKVEDRLAREREDADDEVQRLEEINARLDRKLENADDELVMLRSDPNAHDTVQALDRIAKERESVVTTLDRVAAIWERADTSILNLEDTMDQLRPDDDVPIKGDRERLLSTLESASLVHGQVKVSLLLIELKLRNQLQSLRNDKLSMVWGGPSDEEVIKHMRKIQNEALAAISHVKESLSQQIREMQESALVETKLMKDALRQRANSLQTMQLEHKEMEEQVLKIQATNSVSSDTTAILTAVSEEEKESPEMMSSSDAAVVGISQEVMDQLHTEVLRIVERVKSKNKIIKGLKQEMEECKNREHTLKKELKRAIRRPTKQVVGEAQEFQKPQLKSSTMATPEPSLPLSPSPLPLPVKASQRQSPSKLEGTPRSPVKTTPPTKGIAPLRPSPREIAKRRFTSPTSKLTSSPSANSPTSVRSES